MAINNSDAMVSVSDMVWVLPESVILNHSPQRRSLRTAPSKSLLRNPVAPRKGQFFVRRPPAGTLRVEIALRLSVPLRLSIWMGLSIWLGLVPIQADETASSTKPIPLESLSTPPPQIQPLIKLARVTFEAGPRPQSQTDSRIVGETKYEITYNYRSRTRWKQAAGNRLLIQVRFFDIQWQPEHRIWLREVPEPAEFWTDPLVLHELDHVRISIDPRIGKRYEQALLSKRSLVHQVQPGEKVNQSLVDQLVKQFATDTFDEVSELIAIRYRELDRLTSHGLQPLPAKSDLYELLRGEE